MRTLFYVLLAGLVITNGAIADEDPLEYRNRGGYFEGYHNQPVSSGRDYRVVSFRVWTDSIESELDQDLTLGFYTEDIEQAYPVIQLCDQESHYLLNKVDFSELQNPENSAKGSQYFEFKWPSGPVLLKTAEQPNLREIAAVVRLDSPEPLAVQRVAPVLLSNSSESVQVKYYVLDLYVADSVTVTCTLQELDGTPIPRDDLKKIKKLEGDTYAVPIRFSAEKLEDQHPYQLSIVGSFDSKPGKSISQVIQFVHRDVW